MNFNDSFTQRILIDQFHVKVRSLRLRTFFIKAQNVLVAIKKLLFLH